MESKFFKDTKCANTPQREYLYGLLGKKPSKPTLRYRGSDHGWTFNDFIKQLNYSSLFVTLFYIKDGDCIGGFTKAGW